MALTEKQNLFVREYLVDLNATQAAVRAGYSEKNAEQMGYQLLHKTSVQQAIQKAMKKREQRLEVTQDRVVQELARIAFSDATAVARIVDNGTRVELTDTASLTPSQRAAIAGIKEGKFGIEVRMHDKLGALVKLGEHLGMFSSKQESERNQENNLVQAIVDSAQEDMDTDDLPEVQ